MLKYESFSSCSAHDLHCTVSSTSCLPVGLLTSVPLFSTILHTDNLAWSTFGLEVISVEAVRLMQNGDQHLNVFPPSQERDKSEVHLELWWKMKNKTKQTKACQCLFVCLWCCVRVCIFISLTRVSRLFIVVAQKDCLQLFQNIEITFPRVWYRTLYY